MNWIKFLDLHELYNFGIHDFSFEIIYYPKKHVNFSTFKISSLKNLG
jgi:hypothetical protein